jgi:hypothetical protein
MARVKRIEAVGVFFARDQDGRRYRLHRWRQVLDTGTQDNFGAERPGPEEIRTVDGRAVNYLGKGRYEIVGHPMVPLTSDDPEAP